MQGNLPCVEFSFELLRIYCALRAKEDVIGTCQIFLKGTKTYRQATPLRLQQEDLDNSSFAW